MSGAEILTSVRNGIARLTLNRPQALNALTLEMIVELRRRLIEYSADSRVRAVAIDGAGERAFCAGGDIRALYRSFQESGSLHREFFVAEYPLDYLLHAYPKPVIAVMNGITMGGGMGIAQGSRARLVGERTRVAMPEVGIGLFPDVGASYFLSRTPGSLGPYLALTGSQIRGPDAVYAGLADAYLAPPVLAGLYDELAELEWGDDPSADVQSWVHARTERPQPPAPLAALRPAIDRHFSKTSVAAILDSLDAEPEGEFADWARQTAALLRQRSPTMLAVTLRQLTLGRELALGDCLRMELGMVQQCFEQGDFMEGVRAVIIDKDNAPRWRPERLEDVSEASVDAFFAPRWQGSTHPLAALEGAAAG